MMKLPLVGYSKSVYVNVLPKKGITPPNGDLRNFAWPLSIDRVKINIPTKFHENRKEYRKYAGTMSPPPPGLRTKKKPRIDTVN